MTEEEKKAQKEAEKKEKEEKAKERKQKQLESAKTRLSLVEKAIVKAENRVNHLKSKKIDLVKKIEKLSK